VGAASQRHCQIVQVVSDIDFPWEASPHRHSAQWFQVEAPLRGVVVMMESSIE
jgi:hypothetical protein